jgi:hypothetical protein
VAKGGDKGDSKGGTEQDPQKEKTRRTQMMNVSHDWYQQALQDLKSRAGAAAQSCHIAEKADMLLRSTGAQRRTAVRPSSYTACMGAVDKQTQEHIGNDIVFENGSQDEEFAHGLNASEKKDDRLCQVAAVIGERKVRKGGERMTQVLVLWEGYGIEHATWEPILNIPSESVDRFKGDELPDPDFFDSDVEDDQGHVPQSQYGEVKEKACVRAFWRDRDLVASSTRRAYHKSGHLKPCDTVGANGERLADDAVAESEDRCRVQKARTGAAPDSMPLRPLVATEAAEQSEACSFDPEVSPSSSVTKALAGAHRTKKLHKAAKSPDQDSSIVIFSRCKPGQHKTLGRKEGVVVTMEILETVFHMPIQKACNALGVSATALKMACRKLGVKKWLAKRLDET